MSVPTIAPTIAQFAFHDELKSILDKHQAVIGEIAMVAILSQVAGSIGTIVMEYDGTSEDDIRATVWHNMKIGIATGKEMINAAKREATNGPS